MLADTGMDGYTPVKDPSRRRFWSQSQPEGCTQNTHDVCMLLSDTRAPLSAP